MQNPSTRCHGRHGLGTAWWGHYPEPRSPDTSGGEARLLCDESTWWGLEGGGAKCTDSGRWGPGRGHTGLKLASGPWTNLGRAVGPVARNRHVNRCLGKPSRPCSGPGLGGAFQFHEEPAKTRGEGPGPTKAAPSHEARIGVRTRVPTYSFTGLQRTGQPLSCQSPWVSPDA